jgi:pimeloyl-ACP methyl ester carboxylesterase
MQSSIERRWNWALSAWICLAVALGSVVIAYFNWPPFDRDFWIELGLFIGGFALFFLCIAMALFKSGRRWKRWCACAAGLLGVALLLATLLAAVRLQQIGASIETFQTRDNRGASHAQSNHLAFVRLSAKSTTKAPPIVYLAGGPGGSGILTLLGRRQPVFMAMREFGEVIALDQRGTMPWNLPWLMCPNTVDVPVDRPYEPKSAAVILGPYVRACVAHYTDQGVDLKNFNTVESAEDLEDLRVHLGAEKLTLWGTSYGTHLALAYLELHPDRVHRVILHGVEGPDHTVKLPSVTDAMLTQIARLAAADASLGMPDMISDLRGIMSQLERKPVEVNLIHDGKARKIVLGKYDIQIQVAQSLTSPWWSMKLPATIAEMKRGDYSRYAHAAIDMGTGVRLSLMSLQMDCASGASAQRQTRIAAEMDGSILGNAINDPFPQICEFVDAPDLGAGFRSLAPSDVPILFISGTLDGRTPVSNTEEIRPYFSNNQHIVIAGAGHGDDLFVGTGKILQGMREFMRGQPVSELALDIPRKFEPFKGPGS